MNILYLAGTGSIIGGGEISLLSLLENLDRNRFNPYVVLPRAGNLAEKIKELNVSVMVYPYKRIINPLNIPCNLRYIRNLIKAIGNYNIDLVHANSTSGFTLLGVIAAKISRVPFIWHVRMINSGGIFDLLLGLLSNRIIVTSQAVKNRLRWIPIRNKIHLVYNGVDLDRFNPNIDKMVFRKEIDCRDDDFLVGTIGRFVPFKGYEYFIKTAKIVSQRLLHVKFLIVGMDYSEDNKYLRYLKTLTNNLGMEKIVIFFGNRNDVSQIMSALDLFVFSSIGEPFGRVLIEAMACARPVVAFRSGATSELTIDAKTAFLVKPKDSKALAEKIIYFIKNNNIAKKMGELGRLRVEELFDIKMHTKKIEDLYSQLYKDEDSC